MPVIPLPEPELSDGVVRLRPPEPADAPALVEACRDPLDLVVAAVDGDDLLGTIGLLRPEHLGDRP